MVKKWIGTIPSLYIIYIILRDSFKWVIKEFPMNIEIFGFRIIVILSICYCIYLLVRFLYKINKFINGTEDSVYHKWISDHPDWKYRASGSFEDRVIAMFEWLKTLKTS